MAAVHQNDEEEEIEVQKTKNISILPTTTLATIESLTIPPVQEVVLLADFRCKRCQDRVADILSRLNGEAESVEISMMEKKVTFTLTRTHSKSTGNNIKPVAIYKNPDDRLSLVKRLLTSSPN